MGGTTAPGCPWSGLGHTLAVVDSTMSVARRLASAGAPHGTHVRATRQTHGRGRHGRVWHSGQAGVFMTIVLRPPPTVLLAGLPLAFGLAVLDAVVATAGDLHVSLPTVAQNPGAQPAALGLKWPNDLLFGERKLAGVLLEAQSPGTPDGWVLVGLGINVAAEICIGLAPELRARYIGLMELLPPHACTSNRVCVAHLAQHALVRSWAAYRLWQQRGAEHTTARWSQYDVLRGRTVKVQANLDRRLVVGTACGIGACGRLRVSTGEGALWVNSGEVV